MFHKTVQALQLERNLMGPLNTKFKHEHENRKLLRAPVANSTGDAHSRTKRVVCCFFLSLMTQKKRK